MINIVLIFKHLCVTTSFERNESFDRNEDLVTFKDKTIKIPLI